MLHVTNVHGTTPRAWTEVGRRGQHLEGHAGDVDEEEVREHGGAGDGGDGGGAAEVRCGEEGEACPEGDLAAVAGVACVPEQPRGDEPPLHTAVNAHRARLVCTYVGKDT